MTAGVKAPAILGGCLALLAGCTRPNDAGLVDSVGEQKARADLTTQSLRFEGATIVPGSIENRLDLHGPQLESVHGPETIHINEPFSYRLAVPQDGTRPPLFALLQWKYAENHLRIPIGIDPTSGYAVITGIGPSTEVELSESVDGTFCLESEQGRPGPGIPITYDQADADDPAEAYLSVLSAHLGSTLTVELFDRDGEHLLASGGDDAMATLWNIDSGHRLRTLSGHSAAVTSLAASRDGARLASGSGDHTVRIWDSRSGALLATLGEHRDVVTGTAFSPDGQRLASGSWDGTVRVYDTTLFTAVKTLEIGQRISMVEISSDGAFLAVAAGTMFQRGQLSVWNMADWSLRFAVDLDREATALNISAAADRVAAAVGRGQVYVWDAVSGGLLAALQGGPADTIPRLGFWPGLPRFVGGLTMTGTLFIWDTESGRLQSQKRTRLWLTSADFASDGGSLALGDSRGVVRLIATPKTLL